MTVFGTILSTKEINGTQVDLTGSHAVPGASDDNTAGWEIGSVIIATDGNCYQATDVSTGAAVWKNISASGGGVNTDSTRFVGSGSLASQTGLDGAWVPDRAGTFKTVTLQRGTAGGSGTTTIDVNKNAVTIFTTQANRPSVLFSDGDNAIDSASNMDVTAFAAGDIIQVDVDTVESGPSKNLSVTLTVEYS